MPHYNIIGQRIPRVDGPVKATGEARYVADISLPRMLVGRILRSPLPHARVANIDTSRAKNLRGVRDIILGADTRYGKGHTPRGLDEYPVATDRVRYIGDEVAAVAAVDVDVANEALDLIRVDYEPLPAVFDTVQAMEASAPRVHDVDRNISMHVPMRFGDAEQGFAKSAHVREDSFFSQAVNHGALEPPGALAAWSGGALTVWSATQAPFALRKLLSRSLSLPEGAVRVIKPHVGGGFCGRHGLFASDFCASLLSIRTGRPVKIVYDREEALISAGGRTPMHIKIRTGVDRNGLLKAIHAVIIADNGAYNATAPGPVVLAGHYLSLPYKIPNMSYDGYLVYTNNPPMGSQRGAGNPEIRFAAEVQMNLIAEDLGVDPVELRLRNALHAGDLTSSGVRITSCGFDECLQRALVQAKWYEKRTVDLGDFGIGFACGDHTGSGGRIGPHDSTSALVKLEESGTVTVYTGAADIGQGSDTALCQIAAEELGTPMSDMKIVAADTETTPLDLGSYGSRVTMLVGNAVKAAAADAKSQILEVAAAELEAAVIDLEIVNGYISVKGSREKGLRLSAAVSRSLARGRPVIGRGSYDHPLTERRNATTYYGNESAAYSFGAQVAECRIDRETGQVDVVRVVAAHDTGFSINPMGAEGQIEGCVVTALGQALSEDLLWENGQTLNPNFVDYRMPTALDAPPVESLLIESNEPHGPFGAKGIGESGQVPTIPAVAGALHQALGPWINELPFSTEKILAASEQRSKDLTV